MHLLIILAIYIYNIKKENRVNLLRYASHVACLHVLSACAGAQNPVSALNSNASSLPPLQCDHFVTKLENIKVYKLLLKLIKGQDSL
jgi:hypothetical protein